MEVLIGILFGVIVFFTFWGKKIVQDFNVRIVYGFIFTLILIYFYLNRMEATIYTQIGTVVIMILAYLLDRRKNDKAQNKRFVKQENIITTRDKIQSNKLVEIENQIVKVGMAVDKLTDKSDFENTLRNAIRTKVSQIVILNISLNDRYKNILMFTANQIEEFAFRFYYSPFRDDPIEQEKYLRSDIQEKRAKNRSFADDMVNDVKWYNKEKYTLSRFLTKLNVFKWVEILIADLVVNGLSNEEVIKKFTIFTDKYAEDFIKGTIIFDNLESVTNVKESA